MSEVRFALRADASRAIGMGHLRRMIDLSAEAARRGLPCLFACEESSRSVLRGQGIAADRIVIVDRRGDWMTAARPSHVITDIMWSGNAMAAAQEVSALTARAIPVTVIDSMPPDHFVTPPGAVPPACVITPYLGAETLRPPPRTPDWAAGAGFAVMDASYLGARQRIERTTVVELPHRVLVSCGGSDPTGLSARVARHLAPTGIGIDLVLGPLYPDDIRAALDGIVRAHPNLVLHGPQPGLAPLIESCGLVVGRIGLLRYQAAMLGRSGIYLFEGPQFRAYLEHFAASGLAEVFFADPPGGDAPFLQRLSRLGDGGGLAGFTLNRVAMAAVDGLGAANVIDRVLQQERTTP